MPGIVAQCKRMTACASGTLRDVGAGSGQTVGAGPCAHRPPAGRRPPAQGGPDDARHRGRGRVSQSTVSRVLNDAPTRVPIAAETRERVTLAARRLGYRPNPLARGLRGAPTMLLGAVVRDITDPFFAGAIEALSIEAMARGYNVVLGHAQGRATRRSR